MRSSIFWIEPVAPSVICRTELACSALRLACVIARMSPRSLLAIPRPAASSEARLIRKPEESFSMDFETDMLVSLRFL